MPQQVLDVRQMTQQQVLKRWPRLAAHMEFIERSIQRRHTHYGFMADYNLHELAGSGPALAS